MNDKTHLTFEDHGEVIFELLKLQFFYLWNYLKKNRDQVFTEFLREKVDLVRKLDPAPQGKDLCNLDFKNEKWLRLEKELEEIYIESADDSNSDRFETDAMGHIPHILANFAKKTFFKDKKYDTYQCGCLKYDPPSDRKPVICSFHIGNPIAPKSIFSDRQYLTGCLLDMIEQTEEKYNAEFIATDTWLNSLDRWLSYFPEPWQKNLSTPNKNVRWHYGFWGQFISAKGTFNYKYAEILRRTGELPFYPRSSKCSLSDMKEHLKAIDV